MRASLSPTLRLAAFALASTCLAGVASAKTCNVNIEATDAMQYNMKTISVAKDCTTVKVTLKHTGKLPKAAMGHDWVLADAKDMQAIITAGTQAGLANNYQPKNDKRVIAATKLIGGGETATTEFKTSALKKGESYKYFCTFPGHASVMNGTFEIK